MEFLKDHWAWLASNPLGAIGLAILSCTVGWGFASRLYAERIEVLKEKISSKPTLVAPATPEPDEQTFAYKAHGRHGKNILADDVHEAIAGESLSLHSIVPRNSRLRVSLYGPLASNLSDAMAAWGYFVVGVQNWVATTYQEDATHCVQHFNAEGGPADMRFIFERPGNVHIEVHERESRTPTWTKVIRVRART